MVDLRNKLLADVTDKLAKRYLVDYEFKPAPQDYRASMWLQSDVESILFLTDMSVKDLKKEIGGIVKEMNGNADTLHTVIAAIDFKKAEKDANIRKDFASALDAVTKDENGNWKISDISYAIGYGFSETDISNLAILHKNDTKNRYREKIEELLTDCNFHTECGDFANGRYDEYINESKEQSETRLHKQITDICNEIQDEKIVALAEFLGLQGQEDRIRKADDDWRSDTARNCLYLVDDEYQFWVADEAESNELAKEEIKNMLWSFNSDFVCEHSESLKNAGDRAIRALQQMQETLCEDAQPIVEALIDDMDEFVDDAIEHDGRGHFLATYNEEEHECSDGIHNIYCIDTDEVEINKENIERE